MTPLSQLKPNPAAATNDKSSTDVKANLNSAQQIGDIKLGFLPCALIVFFISLGSCLYSNLLKGPAPTISLFDSGHYMETIRQVVLFIQQLFGANVTADKLSDYLMLDGPIMPIVFAVPFLLFGIAPTLADWAGFVLTQACIQSVSALFVFLLGCRMTGSKKWGIFAGLAWGLYPPAIVCAKHVLSETLVLSLLLALVFVLSTIVRTPGGEKRRFVLAGVLDGLLFLTKPALAIAWGLINAHACFLLSPRRKQIQFVIFAFVGLMLLVVPWMFFTKAASGKYCVTVPRVPTFNLVNGIWPEIEGWGQYPNNPMIAMITEDVGPIPALNGLLAVRAPEVINLSARKIARLWSNPWNDYRYKVLNLNATTQALWHRILLLLGFAGLMVALAPPKRMAFNANTFITYASIEIIAAHLAYAPFESVQRYTYTAMPFVILLAGYFLHHLDQKLLWKRALLWVGLPGMVFSLLLTSDLVPFLVDVSGSARQAFVVSLVIRYIVLLWLGLGIARIAKESAARLSMLAKAGLALLFVGYAGVLLGYAFNTRQIDEWASSLKNGQAAVRQLSLKGVVPDEQARQRLHWALVLVDANYAVEDAKITVNNKVVPGKFVSLYQFDPAHYELINVMQTIGSGIGKTPAEIRQWRAVPVPVEWLNLDGQNEIRIEPTIIGGPRITIYGDYSFAPKGRKSFLAPEYFAHNKLWSTMDGLDGRIVDPTRIKAVPSRSIFVDGVKQNISDLSSVLGKQCGDFRIHLALGFARLPISGGSAVNRSVSQAARIASMPVTGRDFEPKLFGTGNAAESVVTKEILGKAAMASCLLDCPADATKSSHVHVRFSGDLSSVSGPSAFNLVIAVKGNLQNGVPVVLPQTPKMLAGSGQWQHFVIEDEVAVDSVPDGIKKVLIELYPIGGETHLKNVSLQLSPVDLPNFKKHVVSIF
jgi:hypothetical protein